MQRIIISLGLVLFIFSAKAQEDKKAVEEEFKIIKMPKYPIADFPKNSVHISGIEVMQLVRDSVRLGYVKKGLDNHVVQIKPAKPLTVFLLEQIERMYKNDYKADGIKILFVLKELRVGERSSFMEMAYTRFYATAYMRTDGDLYKEITGIDTVFVREAGGDVTSLHGENIQDAFRILVKQTLNVLKDENTSSAAMVSLDQIRSLNDKVYDMPILNAKTYTEGAYASFEEFLQNKPSVLIYLPVKYGKRKIKLVQMKDNNQADTLAVWGLCRNGELYKYEEEYLIPIEKQGNGFIISNYVKLSTRRNNNSLGLMFGLVGVIGDELIKAHEEKKQTEKLMFVRSIPYIQKESKQPEACCIDMKTGELAF